ncbi:FimV/HubP family polar landmark protein [Rhizobacter sp. Root1221]|uniref:FimV/HubP family polar landmark protein n=1 Tax=Rhizobacter sp. Root1221 TaxID=1736433 RepID=UPI000A3F42C0|nr:FimV/HubP family polar landmark protein [Rhizobacter sp. Root1221]
MKRNSLFAGRFALTGVALATMLLASVDAMALGLGRLNVQSGLGETLRAEIDVSSLTADEASNLQVKVATPEAYRAAGVDYNAVLPGTRVSLERRADGRPYLRVTSDRSVQEPFVDVILEISWSTGRLVREYTMLFDPPTTRAAAPAPAPSTAPAISPSRPETAAAPTRAERRAAAAAAAKPAAEASAPSESRRAAAAPAAAPAPRAPALDTAQSDDEYKVRSGDTLSRIAGKTQRQGVSLDQMLVALYQANPDAFLGNNMNRLKSGAVLAVPTADAARAVTPTEARQLIQAQSADFGAYRQRLAGGVPAAKVEGSSRQATGQVTAEVDDRKKTATPDPDKLTLSKGASNKASAPEARLSKEREQKEAAARVAELAKNVEDLKKLSGTPAGSGKPGAPAGAASKPGITAPVATPTVPTPPVKAAPPAPAPAPAPEPAPAPAPAPAPVVIPETASAPMAASAPEVVAAPAPEGQASEPVVAPAEPASAVRPPVPAPAPAAEPEASILDNSLVLALGAALLAVLVGYGIYRFTRRKKKDSGETSFLESRLQPDSFFGASGGQRIDTRDASGASSSMSYSLSQLDAIGDVDPVAEADVYLAYGRDLQAEEILKEAMRASPERLAIRTKLLEVYAKRRDTKGFELLATQLFGLTGGQGEDWAKAQELGQQIEPDNQMYQPGGSPAQSEGDGRPSSELLGASTMPQSVLPSPSEFGSSTGGSSGFDSTGSGVDLDLDLGAFDGGAPAAQPPSVRLDEQTQPFPAAKADDLGGMHFDLDALSPSPSPAPTPAPASNSGPMEFDLSSISLDLGAPSDDVTRPGTPVKSAPPVADLADIDLGDTGGDDADPIARKLELAEEFRQIGDMEGARDLLQEVVAKASGSVKMRAQAMLDELG